MIAEQDLLKERANLLKYAKKITRDNDAEDLVQETFTRALEYSQDIPKHHLHDFLICTLKRLFFDDKKKGCRPSQRHYLLNHSRIDYRYPNQEQIVELNNLWKLPFANLAFASAVGYTYEEISDKVNIPKSTVRKRILTFIK